MTRPLWDMALAPNGSSLGAVPNYWMSINERAMRQAGSRIGKQYELDQAETGEFTPVLSNEDALFSPVNASSPLSPNVASYRPVRWRAQYPPTPNLLWTDQATCGDAPAYVNAPPLSPGQITATSSDYTPFLGSFAEADAWQGGNVCLLREGLPFTGGGLFITSQWSLHPGQAHTYSVYVRLIAGPSGTLNLHAGFNWYDTNGNLLTWTAGTSTPITVGSRTWTRLTVTGTPPANACGADARITVDTATATVVTAEMDGQQVELAISPSAWQQPTWYPIFYGGAERWPQVYDMAGTYGRSQPTVVDTFALLAQVYPMPAFYMDILAMGPQWFYPLDEPAAATSFHEASGNFNPAPLVNSTNGAGSITPGTSLGSGSSTTPQGTQGPCVAFDNVDITPGGMSNASSVIHISGGGAGGFIPNVGWTRLITFMCATTPTNASSYLFAAVGSTGGGGTQEFSAYIGGTGSAHPNELTVVAAPTNSTSFITYTFPANVCDGNWHMLTVTFDGNITYTVIIDDTINTFTVGTSGANVWNANVDEIVGSAQLNPYLLNFYAGGCQATVGLYAHFEIPITNSQVATLYESWRFAWSGDSSGERYQRILAWAGYTGNQIIQGGNTTSMGPASDVDGQTAVLTLLENVVTTENGIHYVRGDGSICFEQRGNRYDRLTPQYIFGEETTSGEWPYEDVAFDFDPTHVVGQAQVTVFATNQELIANSPTVLAPGYRPTFQRTINVTNPQEAQDAAQYIARRYQSPQLRVQAIRLHPAAMPAMWPIALAMTPSLRARVNRRSRNNPLIQFDGFVESVQPQIDFDTFDFVVDLELSPADLQLYWISAALHTTLTAPAATHATSFTVLPFADGFINPPNASFCQGLVMQLDPALTVAEQVTPTAMSGGVPLAPNAQFNGTTGWSGYDSATLATGAGQYTESACVITSTQNVTPTGVISSALVGGLSGSTTYNFGAKVNPQSSSTVIFNIDWYSASSVYLSTTSVSVGATPGSWATLTSRHLSPAGATQANIYVTGGVMAVGQTLTVTNVLFATDVLITVVAPLVNAHALGGVACELLPSGVTDPTAYDLGAIMGTSTTPSY